MEKNQERMTPGSCWNKAKPNELCFVLLDRDEAAPDTIRAWIQRRIDLGLDERGSAKLEEARRCLVAMEERIQKRRGLRGLVDEASMAKQDELVDAVESSFKRFEAEKEEIAKASDELDEKHKLKKAEPKSERPPTPPLPPRSRAVVEPEDCHRQRGGPLAYHLLTGCPAEGKDQNPEKSRPLSPSEVREKRAKHLPPVVFDVFNEIIRENLQKDRAIVKAADAARRIAARTDTKMQVVYDRGWLDVEEAYQKAGWEVRYEKPDFNGRGEAYFEFREAR